MKKRRIIPRDMMPTHPPITHTVGVIALLLALDAPQWVWGFCAGYLVLIWIVAALDLLNTEEIRIKEP